MVLVSSSPLSGTASSTTSVASEYALSQPLNVMVVPEAVNSSCSPLVAVRANLAETVSPFAGIICDATVRFQMRR